MVHVPDRAVPGDRSDGRLSAGCEQKLGRRDQTADAENDEGIRSQILADSFHVVRVAATLLHPFAPEGTEMVREYLGVDERLWDWAYIFEPLSAFMGDGHAFRFLEPRVDFFRKHPSQLGF